MTNVLNVRIFGISNILSLLILHVLYYFILHRIFDECTKIVQILNHTIDRRYLTIYCHIL